MQTIARPLRVCGQVLLKGTRSLSTGSVSEFDVVIVGGGVMGMSSAFQLSKRMDPARICVVEQDSTYKRASSPLSVGSIRQQFSVPENIQLSLWSSRFLRNIDEHLRVDDQDVDTQFVSEGYLFLATPAGQDILKENYQTQLSQGAQVMWMTPDQVKTKYPWMNTDDIAAATFGAANEGWFDPWSLLRAFRRKAVANGVKIVSGRVTGASMSDSHVTSVQATDAHGQVVDIRAKQVVLAAGPWSGDLGRAVFGIDLPVRPRLRSVFMFHCPQGPEDCPMLIDPTGVYVRREGHPGAGIYICGKSPTKDQDADHQWGTDFQVDHDAFTERIWPALAERVPAFEQLKVKNAWAGLYEYNTLDQNAIVGAHPHFRNLYVATGFSGHGIMQSPAVGLAVSELLADGRFITIDLTRFGVERILANQPLREKNVV